MIQEEYTVLIVEDEFVTAKFIQDSVTALGFSVIDTVTNADDAVDLVKRFHIDIVFMDINIDGAIDGIMCAHLINQFYDIPVIYMTAYGDSKTINEAGETNIYGYLIKPFDKKDIEASLGVVTKMIEKVKKTNISKKEPKLHSLKINIAKNTIYNHNSKTLNVDDRLVKLTKKETLLLDLLSTNINQNISYEMMIEKVWEEKRISNSTIRDTILRLRKKVPGLNIEPISGYGYRLNKEP